MKYLYTICSLILVLLLANMALSAQLPIDLPPNDDISNLFPTNKVSSKNEDEENLLIASKMDFFPGNIRVEFDSIEYYYNASNQLELKIGMDRVSGELLRSYNHAYEYDSIGNLSFIKKLKWDGNSWINSSRIFKTYDLNNQLIIEKEEEFKNEEWKNDYKNTYEYDSFGNRTFRLIKSWSSSGWYDLKKTVCEYDANNNLISELKQIRQSGEWRNDTISTYEYDSSNNQILNTNQIWQLNNWVNDRQEKYEYDDFRNLISTTFLRWVNEVWVEYVKHQFFYDANNNFIQKSISLWSNNNWRSNSRVIKRDDKNQELTITQFLENNIWTDYIRRINYYSQEFAPLSADLTPDVNLYPNPSNGQFTLDLENHGIMDGLLEIFNSTGQLVYFQNIGRASNLFSINLEGLSDGTYYLELSDENKKIKQTLMLIR